MTHKEIQKLKKSELQDLLTKTLQQKATLERVAWDSKFKKDNDLLNDLYEQIDKRDLDISNLEMENEIHKREKQEARKLLELAKKYSLSNNQLRNELAELKNEYDKTNVSKTLLYNKLAEGSTPKNLYIHEIDTIFADSGELHLVDGQKSLVINCSNLVQDLATINDMVIKEAKRDLSDSIQQIKELTKDI